MSLQEWNDISSKYYDEVLSPLKNSKENLLVKDLEELSSKKKKVLELGCGVGELIPVLSDNYGEVLATDFSPGMIEKAKEKIVGLENVRCEALDMLKASTLKENYDVVVSVNSVLFTDLEDVDKALMEIGSVTKKNGYLLIIVPAIEAMIYESMLHAKKHISKGTEQKEAIKNSSGLIETTKKELLQGIISFDGAKQKAYYGFEIKHRLRKAGFEIEKLEKVRYNWKDWNEAGQEYHPGEEEPWDWYVKCRKK